MGTRLQPQAVGGSTNLPGHDIQRDQLLSNVEESWRQATEVITTTVLRSMTLKKEALTEDEDKVKMAPNWANTKKTRDEVDMMTTRAVTKDKMGTMEARAAAKMSGQGEMRTVDTRQSGGMQWGCSDQWSRNPPSQYTCYSTNCGKDD